MRQTLRRILICSALFSNSLPLLIRERSCGVSRISAPLGGHSAAPELSLYYLLDRCAI
ncbi:MAG: hypothetical protein WCK47_09545 [bacterium]|nr:hypothetical protein [Candidatus Sumerlaeota bacterium]